MFWLLHFRYAGGTEEFIVNVSEDGLESEVNQLLENGHTLIGVESGTRQGLNIKQILDIADAQYLRAGSRVAQVTAGYTGNRIGNQILSLGLAFPDGDTPPPQEIEVTVREPLT